MITSKKISFVNCGANILFWSVEGGCPQPVFFVLIMRPHQKNKTTCEYEIHLKIVLAFAFGFAPILRHLSFMIFSSSELSFLWFFSRPSTNWGTTCINATFYSSPFGRFWYWSSHILQNGLVVWWFTYCSLRVPILECFSHLAWIEGLGSNVAARKLIVWTNVHLVSDRGGWERLLPGGRSEGGL